MIKRTFYRRDRVIEIKLKNRRVNVEIKGDRVVVISKRLIDKDENLEDLIRAGFRINKGKVAYFKYVASIEAFEEIMQAYLFLKSLEG